MRILKFIVAIGIFLFLSADSWAAEVKTFSQGKDGKIAVPIHIAPILVDVTRRVDLKYDGKTADKVIDLFEFPILKYPQNATIDLMLETNPVTESHHHLDAIVRVGSPKRFPEMLQTHIDMHVASFASKDFNSRLKRRLGLGTGEQWRYDPINGNIDGIIGGLASGSFGTGGGFVLQKIFKGLELSKNSWIVYDYELPTGSSWLTTINAKIRRSGLVNKLVEVSSSRESGGGRRRLVFSLLNLYREKDPSAEDGLIEELTIHFRLAENGQTAIRDAQIDLGSLEFYKSRIPGNPDIVLMPISEMAGQINFYEALQKQLPTFSVLNLLGSRSSEAPSRLSHTNSQSFRLLAGYQEKVPEIFIGDRAILDELTDTELSSLMDQKLFISKETLWESGGSAQVLKGKSSSERLAVIALDTKTSGGPDSDIYLLVDFSLGAIYDRPIKVTIAGFGKKGESLLQESLVQSNQPLRISQFSEVKRIEFIPGNEMSTKDSTRPFLRLNKVEISRFRKTATYLGKPLRAQIGLTRMPPPLFRTTVDGFKFVLNESEDFQIIKSFPVEIQPATDVVIDYDVATAENQNLSYFLRVRAIEPWGYSEKVFPLAAKGELKISQVCVRGLDILTKAESTLAGTPLTVVVNKLELRKQSPFLLSADGKPSLVEFESTLSYDEILSGGKAVALPSRSLQAGHYQLNFLNRDSGIVASIDQMALNKIQEAAAPTEPVIPTVPSKILKVAGFVLFLTLLFLIFHFRSLWFSWSDRLLRRPYVLWPLILVMMTTSKLMISFGPPKTVTKGCLLLALVYGIAVRYFLRKKLSIFTERESAPYFLGFVVLLVISGLLMLFKDQGSAEVASAIGYFLVVFAVIVEFVQLESSPLELKSEQKL